MYLYVYTGCPVFHDDSTIAMSYPEIIKIIFQGTKQNM